MIKKQFNWNEDSVPQGSLCTNNLQWTLFPWGRTIECSCTDCTNVLISSWRFVNSLCLTLQGLYTIVHNELCFSPRPENNRLQICPHRGVAACSYSLPLSDGRWWWRWTRRWTGRLTRLPRSWTNIRFAHTGGLPLSLSKLLKPH